MTAAGTASPFRRPEFSAPNSVMLRSLTLLSIFGTIYLQRIAIPGTSVGIGALIPYVGLVYLAVSRRLSITPRRLIFALSVVAALCLSSVASTTYSPESISPGSIGLLLLMWLPFAFVVRWPEESGVSAASVFQMLMVPVAILAILQFSLQSSFPSWLDPISQLPGRFRLDGYQAAYEFQYGAGRLKANGVFFVESSFASQYLALAALLSLARRRYLAPIFVIALITTGGGTGIVMLLVGLMVYVARGSWRVRTLVVVTVGIGFAVMNWLGLSNQILGRAGEVQGQNTSASLRFVEPYEAVVAAFSRADSSIFWGLGPGTADDFAASVGVRGNFSLIPKLLIEYGMGATVLFVAFICIVSLRLNADLAVRLSVLTMILVLSGALIQAHTTLLLWAFAVCAPLTLASKARPDSEQQVTHL